MFPFINTIMGLTRQLYPTGRAFKMPVGGWMESMHKGLAVSENKAYDAALSVMDVILPDNPNFAADDASDWERCLGLIDGTGNPLSQREILIQQQMNWPGTILARQSYLYLQMQLQIAFPPYPLYVYENRFFMSGSWVTQDPIALWGLSGETLIEHADSLEHGDAQHGGAWSQLIANSIDAATDATFSIGNNQRSTFFISGPTLTSPGTLPSELEKQFRQLVLKIKPVQSVAYLFINYI